MGGRHVGMVLKGHKSYGQSPKTKHRFTANGEGKSRGHQANPSLCVRWPKMVCMCVLGMCPPDTSLSGESLTEPLDVCVC